MKTLRHGGPRFICLRINGRIGDNLADGSSSPDAHSWSSPPTWYIRTSDHLAKRRPAGNVINIADQLLRSVKAKRCKITAPAASGSCHGSASANRSNITFPHFQLRGAEFALCATRPSGNRKCAITTDHPMTRYNERFVIGAGNAARTAFFANGVSRCRITDGFTARYRAQCLPDLLLKSSAANVQW